MKDIILKLTQFRRLDQDEAREALTKLANGEFNAGQMAAFLTSYMMRSITIDELIGFREAMLELCVKVDLSDYNPIDLCGTGGDGKNTFNISTLASFVVAGAGYPVAKHGNNGVSSICGSSNILSHFGYQFTNDEQELRRQLDGSNICFLHAPLFHPAMKNVAPVRKDLGIKTFFNMLGPLVNPSFPSRQIIGVYDLKLARIYGYIHQQLDKRYSIIYSLDGYDEVSLTGNFKLISNQFERILSPEDIGFNRITTESIHGGDTIEEAAVIFKNVLECKSSEEHMNVVVANAGIAIQTHDENKNLEDSIAVARESLMSGKANQSFMKLIELSKESVSI